MTETRLGRLARLLAVGVFAAVLFVAPAAAQSSTTQQLIGDLNTRLLWVGVPITVLVEAILIYAVVKFRGNDDPKETRENRRLEVTWTIATATILLFVGVASYGVLANEDGTYSPPQAAGERVAGQRGNNRPRQHQPGQSEGKQQMSMEGYHATSWHGGSPYGSGY